MNDSRRVTNMRAVAARVICFLVVALAGAASAIESEFVGLGAAPGDSWSDPTNWSPALPSAPANGGSDLFDVLISAPGCPPAGVVFDVTNAPVVIESLTLRADCLLTLLPGTALTVDAEALIGGALSVDGGVFHASSGGGPAAILGDDEGVLDRAQISASNGAIVTIDASEYASLGLRASDGLPSVLTTDWMLFSASDPGTILDLSTLERINAGFSPIENDLNRQFVTADAGATLDLSGARRLQVPAGVLGDSLTTRARDGASIDLSDLRSVQGGRLFVEAEDAEIKWGTLGQHVEFSVDVSESGAAPARIEFDGWVQVFGESTFRSGTAPVFLGPGFVFDRDDPADVALQDSVVTVEAGYSMLEVGGRDYGTDCSLLPDSNFGMGQLRLVGPDPGGFGGPLVELLDRLDSGRRDGPAGQAEALYLFGPGTGPLCGRSGGDGLEMVAGTQLLLTDGGPNLYVWDAGVAQFVDLWALASAGGGCTTAFGGTICTGYTFNDPDRDGVFDSFDVCDAASDGAYDSVPQLDVDGDGYGDACDADYDQNAAVTATDFGIILSEFGGKAIQADHDGNGVVTATDFGIFLQQFGGAPGSSGLSCADPTIRVDLGDAPCEAGFP